MPRVPTKAALQGAATAAYPLAIWLLQGQVALPWLAAVLVALALLGVWRGGFWGFSTATAATLLAAATVAGGGETATRLYPVLINAGLLVLFGLSLVYPPPIAERLARLSEPDLPAAAVGYTRRVTQVWCVFFAVNGSVALYTALAASLAVWSLYNGVVAYLLIGLLFGVELFIRSRVRRELHRAPGG
jgi:uncharacterized membrane protein